jgi:PAS domain S-box-containing protein
MKTLPDPTAARRIADLSAQVDALTKQVAGQAVALEHGTRQRRELLANLSHDLRTPLAAMQGYLELLLLRQGRLETAEARNYLQTAAAQSERLARLVGDLFELTRLEADDMQPQFEPVALAELAHDVAQKFAAQAQRREVALAVRCDACGSAAPAMVPADIALVERVLDNLVDNALRHTPAGGAVTIELGGDKQRARVSVADTGEGIAAEDLPGIFERYDRAARVGGGSGHAGLGLAIAQRIVNLHGSQLQVHSASGEGTRVSFDLPRDGAPRTLAAPGSGTGTAPPLSLADRLARLERRCTEAEADLRATEQRYLLALRGSQDGLWEWDLATGAVHLSPRWKSMLGFESDEIANDLDAWRARVHPDDRAALDAALARHLEVGEPRFDHEMRLLHKDGSVRHVLSRGVAIRRDGGAPYRMVGLDTDVTRLRRAQAVLDAVADGTAGTFGAGFFAAMVQQFARALEVDCAFIAECVDQHPPTHVRTLAYWSASRGLVDNFEFELAGTPCNEVLNEGRACFHREGLAEMFPREAGFESYLGMPIVASDGRVLGHMALFHTKPLGDEVLVDRIYRIFLARAAAEIERLQALDRLAAARLGD